MSEPWEAYRNDPRYRDLLLDAGVQGPHDMERAKRSHYVVAPACPDDEGGDDPCKGWSPALLLWDYVQHTLSVYEGAAHE